MLWVMGFKAWLHQDTLPQKRAAFHLQYSFLSSEVTLGHGKLTFSAVNGILGSVPVAGATAEIEAGDDKSKTSLARIAAGGLLLGPIGLIVGGMVKKDVSQVYVIVHLADGRAPVARFKKSEIGKARKFADRVNAAGVAYLNPPDYIK